MLLNFLHHLGTGWCLPKTTFRTKIGGGWARGASQKFGNLGANGVKGSKFLVEDVIFGIADPDVPIHYATFMGLL